MASAAPYIGIHRPYAAGGALAARQRRDKDAAAWLQPFAAPREARLWTAPSFQWARF